MVAKLDRGRFDLGRSFVCKRAVKLGGSELAPGQPVDKGIMSPRRLRQLWDQRFIEYASGSEAAPSPLPNPPVLPAAPRPRARKERVRLSKLDE